MPGRDLGVCREPLSGVCWVCSAIAGQDYSVLVVWWNASSSRVRQLVGVVPVKADHSWMRCDSSW